MDMGIENKVIVYCKSVQLNHMQPQYYMQLLHNVVGVTHITHEFQVQ